MPQNAQVIISYGPYSACTIVKHRTFRLQGLIERLEAKGHHVTLEEILFRDICKIRVNGEEVFSCPITALDFGGDGLIDSLCLKAVDAVDQAY